MSGQPLPPYPFNQDPDRTAPYRHPASGQTPPPYTQPYAPPPAGPSPWQEGELGPPVAPARRRRRGWILAVVAAVLVVLVGGGGVYAVSLLSGGGTQPEDVLPGDTLAYVRLDLDPAANQKIALFTLARKFPAVRASFSGDDPRRALFELMREGDDDLAGVDYARDVAPWIGERIGFGLLPPPAGSDDPAVVVAVQVTDQARARAGLARLNGGGELAGLAFRDDYALLAPTQQAADAYAKAAPLSHEADFAGDLSALGEPGVLSFWADLGGIAKAAGSMAPSEAQALGMFGRARFAGALRFDGGYAELTGITRGADVPAPPTAQGVRLGALPASTAGAFSVTGLGDILAEQWPKLVKATEGATGFQEKARSYGLDLPADLVTLLGRDITVAVDEQGLDGPVPNVGAVLTTDPAKAQEIVAKLERFAAAESGGASTPQIFTVAGDGRLVLASSQEYADRLAKGGTLGDDETFKTAVPGADGASAALFVDLDKVEKYYLDGLGGEERANLQALKAVGLSARQSGDTASFTLRVLVD
ncbi:DUF3352 domain-containing protein [Sphaerisporangium fuscum]|uniref:DUF3352 domain-containing protein n=1 Tax=Sphaerisporangium fuscum TaxID=2835868 RepID=UPI001BDC623A|nr:DUF3352 domain-containing protein [Sphaerisporangium fuscum]